MTFRMARSFLYGALVAVTLSAGCTPDGPEAPAAELSDIERYGPMCRTALVAAKEFSRRLRPTSVTEDRPVIVSLGPPVRIKCALRSPAGARGEVTADIHCLRQFQRTCAVPVNATLDGKIVQGPGRIGPDRWP